MEDVREAREALAERVEEARQTPAEEIPDTVDGLLAMARARSDELARLGVAIIPGTDRAAYEEERLRSRTAVRQGRIDEQLLRQSLSEEGRRIYDLASGRAPRPKAKEKGGSFNRYGSEGPSQITMAHDEDFEDEEGEEVLRDMEREENLWRDEWLRRMRDFDPMPRPATVDEYLERDVIADMHLDVLTTPPSLPPSLPPSPGIPPPPAPPSPPEPRGGGIPGGWAPRRVPGGGVGPGERNPEGRGVPGREPASARPGPA